MESLVPLPPITKLSPLTTRILGLNPGKFTLQGTNTYLLGSAPPYILFDTAEGQPGYPDLLEQVLHNASHAAARPKPKQLVSDIVLSHKHKDHHAGLPSVLSLLGRLSPSAPGPRVWKFPLPPTERDPTVEHTLSLLPASFQLQDLADNQLLRAPGLTLRILHTPGHTSDSISAHLVEEDALLTADTVLGQGTAVFEDLASYLQSLGRLLGEECGTAEKVYPGHGPVVERGRGLIGQYMEHRLERERQILGVLERKAREDGGGDCVRGEGGGGGVRVGEVVEVLYERYPRTLWAAAERGVGLHLRKLEGEGRVRRRTISTVAGEEEEVWEVVRI